MSLAIPRKYRQRQECPAPQDFADAVELYARRYGRHGTLKFVPWPLNCWVIEFTLMPNDPARLAMQGQKVEDDIVEPVYLLRPSTPAETSKRGGPHEVGYKLDELGVSGMIELLERTNTFSGRGQYASQKEALKDQADKGTEARAKIAETAREEAVEVGMARRRQVFDIPYLTVDIDLKTAPEPASQEQQ